MTMQSNTAMRQDQKSVSSELLSNSISLCIFHHFFFPVSRQINEASSLFFTLKENKSINSVITSAS